MLTLFYLTAKVDLMSNQKRIEKNVKIRIDLIVLVKINLTRKTVNLTREKEATPMEANLIQKVELKMLMMMMALTVKKNDGWMLLNLGNWKR